MTNNLVVIINSLKVPQIKKTLLYEISCTKLQLPPEPLTRGLPPPDPRSLCPQLNLLNPPPTEQNSWVRHCQKAVTEFDSVLAASQRTCVVNTICCIYSNCHMMVNSYSIWNTQIIDNWNKLRKESAFCCLLLRKYIKMHGPQNVKFKAVR